jgi:hypothetical protein
MTKRTNLASWACALLIGMAQLMAGCDSDDDSADPDAGTPSTETHLELAGTWENTAFGEVDVIDDDSWSTTIGSGDDAFATTSTVTKYSNDENYVILEGEDGKFGRNVWTEIDGDSFYSCTVDFGLDSAEDVEDSTNTADDSDPETSGCGNFPWTKLTKQ